MTSCQKSVLTRFAPSPTGSLHLGSARTALFNWLFARHYGGQFVLRIEDTDQVRSRQEHTDGILRDLSWLGLNWDGPVVMQSSRLPRHQEVALQLLDSGAAYRCFCTTEELQLMREKASAEGRPPLYDRRWRDHEGPYPDRPFSVRLKTPTSGTTTLKDMIQGTIVVDHSTLDDMVLLRSDGTPTYMLAVVVDDHDMGVTHILRGDDHLTNAFRQIQLYQAAGWDVPTMGHIPLIHSALGQKLSKREGDLGIDAYRDQGVLPEALFNGLLRLGWAHGDEEKITKDQAVEWFDGTHLSKSPARFDEDKVLALNAYYMRIKSPDALWRALLDFDREALEGLDHNRCRLILPALTQRTKTLSELVLALRPYGLKDLIESQPLEEEGCLLLETFIPDLAAWSKTSGPWSQDILEHFMKTWAQEHSCSFGKLAKPLRLALTGSPVSPSLTDVMIALGPDWTDYRLKNATKL